MITMIDMMLLIMTRVYVRRVYIYITKTVDTDLSNQ